MEQRLLHCIFYRSLVPIYIWINGMKSIFLYWWGFLTSLEHTLQTPILFSLLIIYYSKTRICNWKLEQVIFFFFLFFFYLIVNLIRVLLKSSIPINQLIIKYIDFLSKLNMYFDSSNFKLFQAFLSCMSYLRWCCMI